MVAPLENTRVVTLLEWYSFIGLRKRAQYRVGNGEPPWSGGRNAQGSSAGVLYASFSYWRWPRRGATVLAVWLIGLSL